MCHERVTVEGAERGADSGRDGGRVGGVGTDGVAEVVLFEGQLLERGETAQVVQVRQARDLAGRGREMR